MCRVLLIKSESEILITPHLETFAQICRESKEFQGHGWGMTYRVGKHWMTYKSINPIWEENVSRFGQTRFLMVHARSAFQNKDIVIENNMPFFDGRYVFMFNGELHNVKIKVEGRIGARKIFNFIRLLNNGNRNMAQAFEKAIGLISKRTGYIRAMNIIITDTQTGDVFLSTNFNEDPDYFALRKKKEQNRLLICSQPYPGETGWHRIANYTTEQIDFALN